MQISQGLCFVTVLRERELVRSGHFIAPAHLEPSNKSLGFYYDITRGFNKVSNKESKSYYWRICGCRRTDNCNINSIVHTLNKNHISTGVLVQSCST